MATDPNDREAAEARLWKELADEQIGMLGVVGGEPHHFQPMTAFPEPETGQIWFFTYKDTELADQVGQGAQAMFVLQTKKLWACIGGRLTQQHDRERMDRYWNPVVAAWYPQGKDDPRLTLLRLDADDAQVWISDVGPVKFAWEIARANAQHRQPDLGGRADLNLH
ncbi:pyridoxamine 5'-phosphate oxidase family protein [Phenylobacterium sp.]|jgi:general stress protein 26|uniref:pyridoxamine 5'-phosphate oxidase family protein n=1 Tax=Phenylobacterium sp. TaxID=1871053 RepID=UPI002E33E4C9|nr:pyridoxamine 5'-phosphate oxidase family protein [Phenylobacterium sp.]HEX2561850.1 pyridoxamine 5'-phosphate oxidase family protein [Phenylobacterium sp.]